MDEFLPDYMVSHPKQQHSSHCNCKLDTVLKKFMAYFKVPYMHINDEVEEIPHNLSMADLKVKK